MTAVLLVGYVAVVIVSYKASIFFLKKSNLL